ncbi:PQQ-binding-like beta-propeller repeat protein [Streptomyces sp. NPDC001568]|uniref:outer membrane protein assembly factor BamB family protein n=1 Tax=Streptomyces sp. NPDC001568 TaxID=3364588 RepID=UPI003689CDBF
MTEPPQPPNQPPSPSGYGHLPGPPQPGYGFPPQGPNPYAQQPPTVPQPPVQNGGYGFPPPPQGMPPVPPPPGRNKAMVLIAAAVAGVLVLGAGGYFLLAGDGDDKAAKEPVAQSPAPGDDKPSPSASVDKGDGNGAGGSYPTDLNSGRKTGEDRALWLNTVKMEGPGAGIPTQGQWVVGDAVIKTVDKSVVAYAVADGKEKWKLDLRTEICGLTGQTTPDGRTVMVVKNDDDSNCNQMKLVDLKGGKELWSKEVVMEGLFKTATDTTVTFTGDSVAIGWMGGQSVHRLSTGDKLFSDAGPEGCKPSDYAAGNGRMIAVATCLDADKTVEIQDADPNTGKKTWSYKLPKGFQVKAVYSVSPTVIDAQNRDTKQRGIIVLDDKGQKRNSLSGDGNFVINCGGSSTSEGLQNCGNSVVDGDTIYLGTGAELDTASAEIVAFDLNTGKVKWRTKAGDKKTFVPLKAAGGQLTAYRTGAGLDEPGEIVSLPAGSGTPKVLLKLPSGPAAKIEGSFMFAKTAYEDGRFFLSVTRLVGDGKDEKLLMAFGK